MPIKSILCFMVLGVFSARAAAMLKVVTTTADLGAIVREIAKDKVDVVSIAKGTQDVHQVEAKPSFMILMRDADLVLAQGLELETAWLAALIQGSRNPKVVMRGAGYMELAQKLKPIEVRTGFVSRAEGDVHPGGNPHFQLDPLRLAQAAELIAAKLGELDSVNRDYYKANGAAWAAKMKKSLESWQKRIKATNIKEIVTYHKTFSYFCDRFEIKCEVQLEPRPGIPPTVSHLLDVTKAIRERRLPLILVENYFKLDSAEKLKSEVPGLKVVAAPVSVGGEAKITTNEQLIEHLVSEIEKAGGR